MDHLGVTMSQHSWLGNKYLDPLVQSNRVAILYRMRYDQDLLIERQLEMQVRLEELQRRSNHQRLSNNRERGKSSLR